MKAQSALEQGQRSCDLVTPSGLKDKYEILDENGTATGKTVEFDFYSLDDSSILDLVNAAGYFWGGEGRLVGEPNEMHYVETPGHDILFTLRRASSPKPVSTEAYEVLDSNGAWTGQTVEFNFMNHDDEYILDRVAELEIFPAEIFEKGDLEGSPDILSFVEFDKYNEIDDDDLHVFFTLVRKRSREGARLSQRSEAASGLSDIATISLAGNSMRAFLFWRNRAIWIRDEEGEELELTQTSPCDREEAVRVINQLYRDRDLWDLRLINAD